LGGGDVPAGYIFWQFGRKLNNPHRKINQPLLKLICSFLSIAHEIASASQMANGKWQMANVFAFVSQPSV
jgi:hypothetical protein